MKKNTFIALALVLVASSAPPLARVTYAAEENTHPVPSGVALTPHSTWNFQELGLTPIQNGGRLKPLDSLARETILFETGSRNYQGWDPIDLLLSWLAHPQYWQDQPFIQVGREDVRRQLGLDEKRTRFAPKELFDNFALAQYADSIMRAGSGQETQTNPTKDKNDPRTQELKRILDRIGAFRSIVAGTAWVVIPKVGSDSWNSLASSVSGADASADAIRKEWVAMIRAYLDDDGAHFAEDSVKARTAVEAAVPHWNSGVSRAIQAEAFFNHLRPFLWAWILYLLAALLWISVLWSDGLKKLKPLALSATGLGLILHITGMALRCYVAGRPPVTNMYESVVWVSFGQLVFALILYAIHRNPVVLAVSTTLGMLGLIAGDAVPAMLDPSIQPLVPVLRSNYWLTIHVLTITLGYAAFALTLGIANVTLFSFLKDGPGVKTRITNLNQLTYRAMQFGVVLIAAGTILGGIWADYSWGRFWGWDPKEVWALIVLLCYIVILHARFTVGCNSLVLRHGRCLHSYPCSWPGTDVNFVLGVGLHSYGFSTGGRGAVAIFVCAQLLYVGAITAIKKGRDAKSALAHSKSL